MATGLLARTTGRLGAGEQAVVYFSFGLTTAVSSSLPLWLRTALGAGRRPGHLGVVRGEQVVEDRMGTFAEGLQTRVAFELPQRILKRHLDDFVLVSDDDLRSATLKLLELTRNLIEPAGAAPLAAALKLRDRLSGRKIALVCSGGNINPRQLHELLESGTRATTRAPD